MFKRPVSLVCGLGLVLVGTSSVQVFGETWNSTNPGNWNTASNWNPSSVPNGVSALAAFTSNITATTAITLDTNVTLGSLLMRDDAAVNSEGSNVWQIIDSSNTYKLTFDNGGSGATISADKGGSGPHLISVPIVLKDNLSISGLGRGTANSRQLQLSGNITSDSINPTGLTINNTSGRAVLLSGTNSYTGTTLIDTGGRLFLSNGDANIPTAGLSMNSGALVLPNSITFSRDILVTGTANSFTAAGYGGSTAISSKISGTGNFSLVYIGGAGSNTTITLSGANTYQGGTVINNGNATLKLGAAGALPDVGTVTIYGNDTTIGNTLDLNNISETIGALASARLTVNLAATQAKVKLGTGTLTTGDSTDTTFEGVISSGAGGALVKQGTGSFTLTNANTYTGGTTVNNGKLIVTNTTGSATGTGSVLVNTNGTLAGSGIITGQVTIDAGTISPGNSPGNLTLGSTQWDGAGDYNWQIHDATGTAGTDFDLLTINGTLDLSSASGWAINLWSLSGVGPDTNGDALNFNNAQSYSWTIATTTGGVTGFNAANFVINTAANNGTSGFSNALPQGGTFGLALANNDNDLVLTYEVPEPASLALLALGGLMIASRRRA